MRITLHRWLMLVTLSTTFGDDNPELPLCPTSPQYFPQKLPMHCKMPVNVDQPYPNVPQYPTLPPLPQSFFQSESPDKLPPPIPIPVPPFSRMPGAMPGPMVGPMPGPMPGMAGPMPMPMPMVGAPPHKLPVIVMPFYSQDHSIKKHRTPKPKNGKKRRQRPRKKKKKHYHSHSDTDTDSDTDTSSSDSSDSDDTTSSSEHGFWKGRRSARRMAKKVKKQHKNKKKELKKKKKNLLTPILQYVTKDGYVIFEKQISKNEANDWLKPKTEMNAIEGKNDQKPEEKYEEKSEAKPEEKENDFNPKSAEDFFKADEEDERMKGMDLSIEPVENEAATKREKRQHVKLNPFVNKSNELAQR